LGGIFIGLGVIAVIFGIVRLWVELRKVAVIDLNNQQMVEIIEVESKPRLIPPR